MEFEGSEQDLVCTATEEMGLPAGKPFILLVKEPQWKVTYAENDRMMKTARIGSPLSLALCASSPSRCRSSSQSLSTLTSPQDHLWEYSHQRSILPLGSFSALVSQETYSDAQLLMCSALSPMIVLEE